MATNAGLFSVEKNITELVSIASESCSSLAKSIGDIYNEQQRQPEPDFKDVSALPKQYGDTLEKIYSSLMDSLSSLNDNYSGAVPLASEASVYSSRIELHLLQHTVTMVQNKLNSVQSILVRYQPSTCAEQSTNK